VKAIALDSRSDFVAWFSAIRLAKFGQDLALAYHRNLSTRLETTCNKIAKPFKPNKTSAIDFQKVKGKIKFLLWNINETFSCGESTF